jgi:hypothetical protein
LREVAGKEFFSASGLSLDNQRVGTFDVIPELPLLHFPLLFRSILHDVMELGTIETDAQYLFDSL